MSVRVCILWVCVLARVDVFVCVCMCVRAHTFMCVSVS
jgi:hypothetical protein